MAGGKRYEFWIIILESYLWRPQGCFFYCLFADRSGLQT
nr:MAG TPA: hypothetical protein [Caudoviricetes sp.]DAM58437.1 MAG TPA: hypothetical protein [Caudoviricetes sp.]